jgi:hypothetical protein
VRFADAQALVTTMKQQIVDEKAKEITKRIGADAIRGEERDG